MGIRRFQPGGELGTSPSGARPYADFRAAQTELQAKGVSFQFQDHELSHSIHFFDPNGFLLEITTYDLPKGD